MCNSSVFIISRPTDCFLPPPPFLLLLLCLPCHCYPSASWVENFHPAPEKGNRVWKNPKIKHPLAAVCCPQKVYYPQEEGGNSRGSILNVKDRVFGWRVASYLSVAVRNTSGALCGISGLLPPVDGCSTGPAPCPCSPRAECVVRCVPLKVVSVGSTSVFCFRKLFSFSAHLQKNEARLVGEPREFWFSCSCWCVSLSGLLV